MKLLLMFVTYLLYCILIASGVDIMFCVLGMVFLSGVFVIDKLEDIHKEIKKQNKI